MTPEDRRRLARSLVRVVAVARSARRSAAMFRAERTQVPLLNASLDGMARLMDRIAGELDPIAADLGTLTGAIPLTALERVDPERCPFCGQPPSETAPESCPAHLA